jgi:hypothetical protein
MGVEWCEGMYGMSEYGEKCMVEYGLCMDCVWMDGCVVIVW